MSNPNQRIPDDRVAEVLAEAARLHAETHKGYSLADLQQICSEAQISAHLVEQAVKNVEESRSRQQAKQRELRAYIQQQIKRGLSVGIMLLIPTIAVSSLFIFRSQLDSLLSGLVARVQPKHQPVTAVPSITKPSPQPSPVAPKAPPAPPKAISHAKPEPPKPSSKPVISREEFRSKVKGMTKQEVIQAVGRPDRTTDTQGSEYIGDRSHWYYNDGAKDPASGRVGSASITFENGIVDSVDFYGL